MKFRGEIGDVVYFERGQYRGKKADRTPWIVKGIEMEPEKCHWQNGGRVPLYIELEGEQPKGKKLTVHTNEKFLVNNGGKSR